MEFVKHHFQKPISESRAEPSGAPRTPLNLYGARDRVIPLIQILAECLIRLRIERHIECDILPYLSCATSRSFAVSSVLETSSNSAKLSAELTFARLSSGSCVVISPPLNCSKPSARRFLSSRNQLEHDLRIRMREAEASGEHHS